ncbi:uncharacterized protein SPPG_03632 [Spizellomyces punctatus DAOM BR117]|uniref:Uncharacterized protein n=1 Tax=Spizellomyces punctatus (strain DAOM BR117) TaxID=645134 RepID=A0A0L0HL44_SPIPD|nr:uncharacterized protein SPPG_03632 [Spizellomyces punctatus DAOM BR117]KND01842.1 hypothetical protein SPPG_03632 [Spizellomyces punctatus DAOM BR117]|eukprot:XP_016609881.1 hypothetical protein SPPG_03632 [Spizellomyces punctatus DAOM BR117]
MSLGQKITTAFEKALASSHLFFIPSQLHIHPTHGIAFQIRLAPSLTKKPDGYVADKRNPFLPYDPAMFVHEYERHVVLLNKFSVVKGHVLVVTKEFESQMFPLNAHDFSATWNVMTQGGSQYLGFYNCGPESGASVPHKHIQLIPASTEVDDVYPPLQTLISTRKDQPGTPFSDATLPFAHGISLLPATPTPTTLETIYKALVQHAFRSARLDPGPCLQRNEHVASGVPDAAHPQASYNMIMTREFMMVVPRRVERAFGVSVNSVGFAGMLLVKNEEQLEVVKRVGPMEVLKEVGCPVGEEVKV